MKLTDRSLVNRVSEEMTGIVNERSTLTTRVNALLSRANSLKTAMLARPELFEQDAKDEIIAEIATLTAISANL